jgi:hypothetical protein
MKKWRQTLSSAASFGNTEVKNGCRKSRISAAQIALHHYWKSNLSQKTTCP